MTLKEQIMKLQTYKMFEGEDTVYVERDDVIKALEQEPCEDAVSREDALMALTGEWTELTDELIHRFIRRIKALPSVKPQRAKGHWSDECVCSVCSNQPWYAGSTFRKDYKFCPYCGAEMRGEEK